MRSREWGRPNFQRWRWREVGSLLFLLAVSLGLTLPGIGQGKSLGGALTEPAPLLHLDAAASRDEYGPDFGIDDRWNQTYTWLDYFGRTTCRGRIPKWNENELGGYSHFAMGSTGSISPFSLLSCPFPPSKRLFVSYLFAFCVNALGTLLFLRAAFGLSTAAASAGALAFGLSGVAVAYALFPHGFTGSWIGFLALSALLVRRASSRQSLAARGLAHSLLVALCGLTGQPEMFLISTGGAILAAYLPKSTTASRGPSVARFGQLASFSILGALLAAAQLIPTAIYSLNSVIGRQRSTEAIPLSALSANQLFEASKQVVSRLLLGSLDPIFHGLPGPKETLTAPPLPYSRVTVYAGTAVLAAALTAVVQLRNRPNGWRLVRQSDHFRAMILAFVSALVAVRFPLTQAFISRIPILSSLDVSMVRWLYCFFLAIFAGLCMSSVIRSGNVRTFLALFSGFNLLLSGIALALTRTADDLVPQAAAAHLADGHWLGALQQTWQVHFLVFVLAALMLCVPLPASRIIPLTVGLIALEMTGVQANIVNRWGTVDPVVSRTRPLLKEIESAGERMVGISTPSPTLGTLLDVPMLNGYELMNSAHRNLAESVESCKGYSPGFVLEFCGYPVLPLPLTQFGNVGWILGPKGLESPSLEARTEIGTYQLYRLHGALGRSFFAEGTNCKPYQTMSLRTLDASVKTPELVTSERRSPEHFTLDFAPSPRTRCLFVSETFDTGWSATANPQGSERSITAFAGIWLAVDLLPGDSGIDLAFSPPGYAFAARLNIITLFSLPLLYFVMTRSKRTWKKIKGRPD